MTDIQYQVQQAIDWLVESGAERGLQVAAYRNGELVVDAVAGVADPETGRPVTSDTLFFSYSIGKGVASTVVHVLAERGVLDYDTRIAELWPEFGAQGKEGATVRHALSQSVGVPGLPSGLTAEDLTDWEEMCGELPEDSPIFKLGPDLSAADANRSEVLGANILAGGTVTARAVARMYAALFGRVDGGRPISPERLREVLAWAGATPTPTPRPGPHSR